MADTVYLYPKSSCNIENCRQKYPVPQGPHCSLGIQGCTPSDYFDCYNRVELKREIQPQNKQGWRELNPQAYTNKIAEGFNPIGCKIGGCPQPSFISMDPRQYDQARAEYLPLDRPPIDGNVRLKNVYDPSIDDYGIGFTPYEQIRDGQIIYYIDKSIEDAFYKPVFSEPALETAQMFVDPMTSFKPEYNRQAMVNTENPTTTTAMYYPYCLSSIQDSQSHREDLMALQQRKNNQSKWSARWAGMN